MRVLGGGAGGGPLGLRAMQKLYRGFGLGLGSGISTGWWFWWFWCFSDACVSKQYRNLRSCTFGPWSVQGLGFRV